MKYKTVKNLQWANAEHTIINCEVDFDDLAEEFVAFAATEDDLYSHTKEIFAKAIAGDFGEISEFETPVVTASMKAARIRSERNELLAVLDSVTANPLRWAGFSYGEKTQIAEYRQALLDVPQQSTFPESVVYPEKPVCIK